MNLDISTDSVNVSVINAVATVTLNRPRVHNAWDDTLGFGLERAFMDLGADPEVRAIVLTGTGSTFCSGADLATGFPQLPSGHDDLLGTLRRRFNPGFLALVDAQKPVISAVNGPAIGAGACLALASDVAIMGRQAYMQFRFSAIGLMPDVGATALLTDAVGPARAMEIFMLADKLDAEQCRDLGLVSRISEDPVAAASELAQRLAEGPTRAYGTTKKAIRRWSRQAFADQLELEGELQQTLVASADWAEGRSAFLERRTPKFRGQ
ncbi:enoyl-CoA hydratase/isomerase family protein [Prescottella agglutinans]|nr:enoyl-CoA hydratase-related protein [Prescottella agglutinans]